MDKSSLETSVLTTQSGIQATENFDAKVLTSQSNPGVETSVLTSQSGIQATEHFTATALTSQSGIQTT